MAKFTVLLVMVKEEASQCKTGAFAPSVTKLRRFPAE